jgi:RNA polymerase sigma-70 factor (ECF subfamily)
MTMNEDERSHAAREQWSTQAFETHRSHLHGVAYRMLGSVSEADDAVQEAWLRMSRAGTGDVRDLRPWLSTVVARIALDMLRARATRREEPMPLHLPDPIVEPMEAPTPEDEALTADAVGLALLVVLDRLGPTERLAFVLHDIFAVPFEEIGRITGRSTSAAKQLASRARRRVREDPSASAASRSRQRQVLDAFLAASRGGDFDALVSLLDPDVVLHADAGPGSVRTQTVRGAAAVAGQARRYASLADSARPVLINGMPGLLAAPDGRPFALFSVALRDGRIVQIDIIADPVRLERLGITG